MTRPMISPATAVTSGDADEGISRRRLLRTVGGALGGMAVVPVSQHGAQTATEPAPWSAYRDVATPYGFASFDVDPYGPHGTTTITVTHYGALAGSATYAPLDTFVLTRPRKRGGHRLQDAPAYQDA
jgi:hypothetical protein